MLTYSVQKLINKIQYKHAVKPFGWNLKLETFNIVLITITNIQDKM